MGLFNKNKFEFHPSKHLYTVEDIINYLENKMEPEEEEKFIKHLNECDICENTCYKIANMELFLRNVDLTNFREMGPGKKMQTTKTKKKGNN
jgi:hypothetical protein